MDYSKTASQRLRSVTLAGEMANMIGLKKTSAAITGTGVGGGGAVSIGTGTPNRLSKWLTATSLGDSHFIDDGTATDLSYGNNAYSRLFVTGYGFSGGVQYISEVICRFARGVQGAITPVMAGDFLGVLSFRGCDSNGSFPIQEAAKINATATPAGASWTTSDHGTSLGFWTTALGAVQEHLRVSISSQGRLNLYSGDSDYYANSFASPSGMTGSRFYTLPASLPAVSGNVLSCDNGGNMSWAAPSGGFAKGSVIVTFTNTPGSASVNTGLSVVTGVVCTFDYQMGDGVSITVRKNQPSNGYVTVYGRNVTGTGSLGLTAYWIAW